MIRLGACSLVFLVGLGCRDAPEPVASPASDLRAVDRWCRHHFDARPGDQGDKGTPRDQGQRYKDCLLDGAVVAGGAGELLVREVEALGRSNLFCPDDCALSPEERRPCWRTDCPNFPFAVEGTSATDVDGRTFQGVQIRTEIVDPEHRCCDDAAVFVLGRGVADPESIVVRVSWTHARGNWEDCWLGYLRRDGGRLNVHWVSDVYRCG